MSIAHPSAPSDPPSSPPRGLAGPRLYALLAITLWGLSFVATRVALQEVAPLPLIAARLVLGLGFLLALLAARGELRELARVPRLPLAALGFFGISFHLVLQAYALRLTSAVHTGWLIGLIPIWSALLAARFLGERLTGGRILGLALGFGGALLVITRGRLDATTLALPGARGDLLILLSTVNWAAYTIAGRSVMQRVRPRAATAFMFAVGLATVLPLALATAGPQAFGHWSARAWAAVLFLGVGCSGFAFLLWSAALERLSAARVAAFLYLEPLVTLAAAALYLHEPVGATTVAGGLVVLLGVALVQRPDAGRAARATGVAERTGPA
jgi:drug/metabolite transporter (DMT)-like permease